MLAKDAAGILWEMVALGETGQAATEMRTTAEQLQVCHRDEEGVRVRGDSDAIGSLRTPTRGLDRSLVQR